MKIFFKSKDGGTDSNVTGYWLIEWKRVFSIVLLRFDKGSREAFHTHAFNAVSWVLSGELAEYLNITPTRQVLLSYLPSILPVYTSRERYHRVSGIADKTWVLSFRGPWAKEWKEYLPAENKEITLTSGRVIIGE